MTYVIQKSFKIPKTFLNNYCVQSRNSFFKPKHKRELFLKQPSSQPLCFPLSTLLSVMTASYRVPMRMKASHILISFTVWAGETLTWTLLVLTLVQL